jgi:tripartite-type tricarboxylate transporter receptor subunit TctC
MQADIRRKRAVTGAAIAALAAAAALSPVTAMGQAWPAKPVRMVVPFPAGGAVDTVARTLGQKATDNWKQQVVVDNKPGAGGNIGADAVAKAAPDGYTLLMTTQALAIGPSLFRKMMYDAQKDLVPVTQLTSSYLVLAAGPSIPANTLGELIAAAKAKPGSINYGSTGIGSAPHLIMELFKSAAGVDLLHVPYKGDGPQNQAMLAGDVAVAFSPLSGVIAHMRSGKLRVLAMTGAKRAEAIPNVPTFVEAGVAGFEQSGWLGVFAPAGTPAEVVRAAQAEMSRAINLPDVKEKLPVWGYEPVGNTPEAFAAKFRSDLAGYGRAVREARIPLQD